MPNAGRADYDAQDNFHGLHAGEPYFRVRGQDILAGDNARDWAARAHASGVSIAVVEQALQQADRLDACEGRRLPNADHLSEAEVKQLEYQFRRRAHAAAHQAVDPRIMLAQERALEAVLARVRPVLSLLIANGVENPDGTWTYTPPKDGNRVIPLADTPIQLLQALADLARPRGEDHGHPVPARLAG